MERNEQGRFVKGHKVIQGSEKGQFPKGHISWSKLHHELMPQGENHPQFGKHLSPEVKEKLRQFNLGRKFSTESNKKKGHPREANPNWRGGQYTSPQGYIFILMPEHPHCNKMGYIKRATWLIEQHLGRYLIPPEMAHHINGIKTDDKIENLCLCANQSEHLHLYRHARKPKVFTT